jgi:ATP-dependent helicase/nuclease subunit B
MADRLHPAVYTIPPHRAFADALVAGLIAQFGKDRMAMARGTILVPNNRAGQAISDAFVRQCEAGLLLPRLVAVGDPDLGERTGAALDPVDSDPIPPAVDPLERQLILARLIQETATERQIDAAEAMRLAADLARTLDQLIVEEIDPEALRTIERPDLTLHWQKSLDQLSIVLDRWPSELSRIGRIDLADRRNRQLHRVADLWRAHPPPGFVVAAGISTGAPAIANLVRLVARLERGQVVLAGVDLHMPDEEWIAIGGDDTAPAIETHPQFHLWQLLDRIGVARAEVRTWRWGSDADARAVRTRVISNALAPARFTSKWIDLPAAERSLNDVRGIVLATPAEEAQAIAIAIRAGVETPGRTIALITPDRDLALRVSAQLERWGIKADDSAGKTLSATPPGALLLALATAAVESFAPVSLLALLKHPLAAAGDARRAWLDGARALDLALRGPAPAPRLVGVAAFLAGGDDRVRKIRDTAAEWWRGVVPLLMPLEAAFSGVRHELSGLIAVLREVAETLAGDRVWAGQDGRAAADLIASLEVGAAANPLAMQASSLPHLLRQLMDGISVRAAEGGHPRVFIWGLLEAKLQSAHMMILGGLNEGVWPALPSPDPWLAPAIRAQIGLPSLERRIGLSAHDLAGALGAPDVLMTRAARDASAPTIASRFWLRLEAMAGGLRPDVSQSDQWARLIDGPDAKPVLAKRPAPCPPMAARPKTISVTAVDRLKADPFSFYAQSILGLSRLDAVDAEPGPAWRGSIIHRVFEDWARKDDYRQSALRERIEALLRQPEMHPLLRSLWQPRLVEAAEWIAARVAADRAEGREPVAAEEFGTCEVAGVTLKGRIDRADRLADGGLVIVDYKTGTAPSTKQIEAGFALQLGLMGVMAEMESFTGVAGVVQGFEYWMLSRDPGTRTFGKIKKAVGGRNGTIDPADLTSFALDQFSEAAARWLTGNAPFTAKLHPEYAPYGDYDQLMRLQEWYGRE